MDGLGRLIDRLAPSAYPDDTHPDSASSLPQYQQNTITRQVGLLANPKEPPTMVRGWFGLDCMVYKCLSSLGRHGLGLRWVMDV